VSQPYPGYDTYTGRWCKCGHREEDHAGGAHECWSTVEAVAGMGQTCSCYRFALDDKRGRA
jgi:hypothetical protein